MRPVLGCMLRWAGRRLGLSGESRCCLGVAVSWAMPRQGRGSPDRPSRPPCSHAQKRALAPACRAVLHGHRAATGVLPAAIALHTLPSCFNLPFREGERAQASKAQTRCRAPQPSSLLPPTLSLFPPSLCPFRWWTTSWTSPPPPRSWARRLARTWPQPRPHTPRWSAWSARARCAPGSGRARAQG